MEPTIEQIICVLDNHLNTRPNACRLVHIWTRLAEALAPWHEQRAEEAIRSAQLHAGETG